MAQMYKVFTDKGVIFFSQNKNLTLKFDKNENLYRNIIDINSTCYERLSIESATSFFMVSQKPKEALYTFFADHQILSAAGGLVINKDKKFLTIYRNGKWDLPKGKIEKDETIEAAAIREVEEECGISGLTLLQPLLTTYHTYALDQKRILKPTHWFLMHYNGTQNLVPQEEEGITKVTWMDREALIQMREESYPSIRDVIDSFLECP